MLELTVNVRIGQVWRSNQADYKGGTRLVRVEELLYFADGSLRGARLRRVNADGSDYFPTPRTTKAAASLFTTSSRNYGYYLITDASHAAA